MPKSRTDSVCPLKLPFSAGPCLHAAFLSFPGKMYHVVGLSRGGGRQTCEVLAVAVDYCSNDPGENCKEPISLAFNSGQNFNSKHLWGEAAYPGRRLLFIVALSVFLSFSVSLFSIPAVLTFHSAGF